MVISGEVHTLQETAHAAAETMALTAFARPSSMCHSIYYQSTFCFASVGGYIYSCESAPCKMRVPPSLRAAYFACMGPAHVNLKISEK